MTPVAAAAIDIASVAAHLAAVDAPDAAGLRRGAAAILKAALAHGRDVIAQRLEERPSDGLIIAGDYAALTDAILRLTHDFTLTRLFVPGNRTQGERLGIVATGGYGRSEMAAHSDVDILFLSPSRANAWAEQRAEAMLYLLWDLGLKIGQQTGSVDEIARLARSDMTVRTALLEARHLCGDPGPFEALGLRFADMQAGTAPAFVAAKLAERNARHLARGDSRYVVEPDVKEGKGGLRDLHALLWIGKYAYRARRAPELVAAGLLTAPELRRFGRAERFFWAVRCHLHILSGRAEERVSFDAQRAIASRMRFADRAGQSAVERFMQVYFGHAKTVGDLSGLFLAQLDETFATAGARFGLPNLPGLYAGYLRLRGKLDGFVLERGRIASPDDGFFAADPVRLIHMFALAAQHGLEIHPSAMRAAARDARLITGEVRADPSANAHFLDVLTSPRDPEPVLRWMNEAGVLGRFIPDFGRIVARMQFDMYHHYTVDEHTIRAIGLLSGIERGRLREDHPLATALFRQIASRRALYVAVLLHDIAKGRGGDHSELGADIADALCPRLGLTRAETETVVWLVRNHLLMTRTTFKRDLADPKTIADFVSVVQSPERLRLLALLTIVDVRAVGPSTWNGWKSRMLRDLYEAAEQTLRLGHRQRGRSEVIAARMRDVEAALGWDAETRARMLGALPDAWWIAEKAEVQAANARHLARAAKDRRGVTVEWQVDSARAATLVSVVAPDRPGLFHRIVAAIGAAGGNIIDARVYTTADGRALDNILIQRMDGTTFVDPQHLARLIRDVRAGVDGRLDPANRLAARRDGSREQAFPIAASALVVGAASNRYTVVEVNAAERPGLLGDLSRVLLDADVAIHSAHIATYGERAVDVFYLTDGAGEKIVDPARLAQLAAALEAAAAG